MRPSAGILGGPSLLDLADDGSSRVAMMVAGAKATRTFPAFQKWAIETTALRARLTAAERAEVMAAALAHRQGLIEAQIAAELRAAKSEQDVRDVVVRWLAETSAWSEEAAAAHYARARRRVDIIIGIETEEAA